MITSLGKTLVLLLALPAVSSASPAMKPIYVKPKAASKDIGPEPYLETNLKLGSRCQRWNYSHNFFTPLFEVQMNGAIVFANSQKVYTKETLKAAGNRKTKPNAKFEAIDTSELNAEVTIRLLDLRGKNQFPNDMYWAMSKTEGRPPDEKVWSVGAIFDDSFDSILCFPSSYPDPKSLTEHEVRQIVVQGAESGEMAKLLAAEVKRISVDYGLVRSYGEVTAAFSHDCKLWEWAIDVFTGKLTQRFGAKPNCEGY